MLLGETFKNVDCYGKYVDIVIPIEILHNINSENEGYMIIRYFLNTYYPNLTVEEKIDMIEFCKKQDGDFVSKLAKTFFLINFSSFISNPYSSHVATVLRVLGGLDKINTIIEIGCGGMSSKIFGSFTKSAKGSKLISIDEDSNYSYCEHDRHQFMTTKYDEILLNELIKNEKIDLVFIDGHDRYRYFEFFKNKVKNIIVHDVEAPNSIGFPLNWRSLLNENNYIIDDTQIPWTLHYFNGVIDE